jgi:hypothetical protein
MLKSVERRTDMMLKQSLAAAAAIIAFHACATLAQAGPMTGLTTPSAAAAGHTMLPVRAARHCRWQGGRRVCTRRVGPRVSARRYQGSDYYEHIPEKLPYGSQGWWDQMMRENRAGNPGGGRD